MGAEARVEDDLMLQNAPEELGPDEWAMTVEWMDPERLEPNPDNPNEQTDEEFNALCASIQQEGWTAAVSAVAHRHDEHGPVYQIVAGEHRWRASKVLGSKVPVLKLDPETWSQDRRNMMLVKDNIVTGKLNSEKFAQLYEKMAGRYDAEVLQELMGFTSQDAFRKVYKGVKDALPKELQTALEESREEIKTIDGLALVLNKLFAEHGETLPADYMVFSYGSKEVLWVQVPEHKQWKVLVAAAAEAHQAKESFADRVAAALKATRPKSSEQLADELETIASEA
jgi:ParB/RepB/Spo0J family partition protein